MPIYSYQGINLTGKKVSGAVDAENIRAARTKLRRMNLFPTEVVEGGKSQTKGKMNFSRYFQRIKVRDLANMVRQLATLVGANIPLVDALSALVEQVENVKLRDTLSQIRERVNEGARLSDAMRAYPTIFGDLFINMIAAGEASGALEVVLLRLAEFTENQAKLRSKVIGALFYPIMMMVVGTALLGFLLIYVVPKITKIFEDTKAALPLPTKILVAVSHFAASYWMVILFLIPFLIYGFTRYKKTEKGRLWLDKMVLRLPIFGELFRMIAISRFCRTLSTLMNSGVQLLVAMDIVKNIVQNSIITQAIEDTKISVKEGESIAEPLKRSGQFPPIVTQMIAIGEKTGELENMLEKVADAYDQQVDTKVSTLTTLLEPIMIVVMGAVVASIVLSIMLPILKLNQVIRR